jgi:hypothetical protein
MSRFGLLLTADAAETFSLGVGTLLGTEEK